MHLDVRTSPEPQHVKNLMLLVKHILDPVEAEFGQLIIEVGYCSTEAARLLELDSIDPHRFGYAATINHPQQNNFLIADWIIRNCEFDELVYDCDYDKITVSYVPPMGLKQLSKKAWVMRGKTRRVWE